MARIHSALHIKSVSSSRFSAAEEALRTLPDFWNALRADAELPPAAKRRKLRSAAQIATRNDAVINEELHVCLADLTFELVCAVDLI